MNYGYKIPLDKIIIRNGFAYVIIKPLAKGEDFYVKEKIEGYECFFNIPDSLSKEHLQMQRSRKSIKSQSLTPLERDLKDDDSFRVGDLRTAVDHLDAELDDYIKLREKEESPLSNGRIERSEKSKLDKPLNDLIPLNIRIKYKSTNLNNKGKGSAKKLKEKLDRELDEIQKSIKKFHSTK